MKRKGIPCIDCLRFDSCPHDRPRTVTREAGIPATYGLASGKVTVKVTLPPARNSPYLTHCSDRLAEAKRRRKRKGKQ